MPDLASDALNPMQEPPVSDNQIIEEINASNEKDYLQQLKKKNKDFLISLDDLEKEKVAEHILDLYEENKTRHGDKCDKIDLYDEVFRMVPNKMKGDSEDMPNYRSPLSTVTLEVVHANLMNVIFTPVETMRVLPTEANDIPKVKKLTTFGNWSMTNEMNLFENCDRLFHSSGKIGECPCLIHWVKEYGTEIKREIIMNPANPTEPLVDPDTEEPMYQETEKPKLLYNGPKMEVFSRKDYIYPDSTVMGEAPEWEMKITRMSVDSLYREELQGKMYSGSTDEVSEGAGGNLGEIDKPMIDGDEKILGKDEREFIQFYGRLRLMAIRKNEENDEDDFEELEDIFIALVNIKSRTLCQLRKNKFPLKESPIINDYFIPDDEGRPEGLGVMEMMDGPQTAYDALFNQYLWGTIQSNNPAGFFTPFGNMRNEPLKIKNGYMFPTADPQSVNFIKIPPPDGSLKIIMDTVTYWSQLLFGISDYSAGLESNIDPSASGKKVQEVVAQGSVRLNIIIKRKVSTLQKIFRKWFLLYKENMPPNKFMRIVGDSNDNPWKFDKMSLSDFALNSIPDFELTGNVLNVNKTLEASKAFAVYAQLSQNFFFMPQTMQGIQALHSLTKWLIDKIDDVGLARMLPEAPGDMVLTPEEENARFLQGESGDPMPSEDVVHHIKVHNAFIADPNVPPEAKQLASEHVRKEIALLQQKITQQMVFNSQMPPGGMMPQGAPMGASNAGQPGQGTPPAGQGFPAGQVAGMR